MFLQVQIAFCFTVATPFPKERLDKPVQEANAAILRMNNGISTGEQEALEYNGSDFMENVAQIAKERKAMSAAMPKEDENDG